MTKENLTTALWLLGLVALICTALNAQEKPTPGEKSGENRQEETGRFFSLKVPDGFVPQPSEEAGILKWRKGAAEVYLVMGGIYSESPHDLFNALVKAAKANEGLEKVTVLKIRGGVAFKYRDKPPQDPGRMRTLRLVVITEKKIFNLDCSAPAKEFPTFLRDFEACLKSFKLNPS